MFFPFQPLKGWFSPSCSPEWVTPLLRPVSLQDTGSQYEEIPSVCPSIVSQKKIEEVSGPRSGKDIFIALHMRLFWKGQAVIYLVEIG